MNYARRQQYRRLWRATTAATASAGAVVLAFATVSARAVSAAGVLVVLAIGLGLYARRWLSLAGRSRVGARSEDEVRRALTALQAEGWRLRHSLPWQGGGDIDSLAIAPTGPAFVVETKTRSYDDRHLARVREQVAWLSRRCRQGVVPVVCLVRARRIERVEQAVLVVSIDRLIPSLRQWARRLGWHGDELGMRGRFGRRKRHQ